MPKSFLLSLLSAILLFSCKPGHKTTVTITSHNRDYQVTCFLYPDSSLGYKLEYFGEPVVDSSGLGFEFEGGDRLQNGLLWLGTEEREIDETWEQPWGEQRLVHNLAREVRVKVQEARGKTRRMDLVFRVFDDGCAFRYEFPAQVGWTQAIVDAELTTFQLASDPECWWIPGDYDSYEHLYRHTRFSEINALPLAGHQNLIQTSIPLNAVNTPFTLRDDDDLHISFHEANLTDYPGMTLRIDTAALRMSAELVPAADGHKARIPIPFATPWRTIVAGPGPQTLLDSRMVLNLNEPNQLGDVSYVKPMKYVGIWWDMHLDRRKWDYASGNHGATTEYAKEWIDFAAQNGIGGLLVEGWNTGWENWFGTHDREGVFDFVTPYPDYDLEAVARYAQERGVALIMHHETSAAPRTYEQQLDTAYALMQRLGIHTVKTGYVGPIIPDGEHHHGQWMVQHYRRVIEHAARHQVAVNAHEPIKPTGLRRTFPNEISREGLRGQEFNAWSSDGGNPPEHLCTVPFTRGMAGPIDYTPGIFKLDLQPYKPDNAVPTTLAYQLALYVVIYSPVQMAADLMEHYRGQPAFQFIRDVGVDWEQSLPLSARIGEYVVMAREERGTGNWFIGGITGQESHTQSIPLDFLPKGKTYQGTIYRDGPGAIQGHTPTQVTIETRQLNRDDTLDITMGTGGGFAVSLLLQD